jgi:hypothetical protein
MIWTLRIECVFGHYLEEECIRTIEIESGSSLLDLHDTIQDVVDFDRDHLFEFFAGRNYRNTIGTLRYEKAERNLENQSQGCDTRVSLSRSAPLLNNTGFGKMSRGRTCYWRGTGKSRGFLERHIWPKFCVEGRDGVSLIA